MSNENQFDTITDLTIRNINFQNIKNSQSIFKYFKRSNTLFNLDISDCSLADLEVNELFFEQLCVKKLNLSGNHNIQVEGWRSIFRSLFFQKETYLQNLRLDRCYIPEEAIEEFYSEKKEFFNKNRFIKFHLNKFFYNKNSHQQNQSCQKASNPIDIAIMIIELRENNLVEEDMIKLAEYIHQSKYLRKLILRDNPGLGESNSLIKVFEIIFKCSTYFEKFDISGCNITDEQILQIIQLFEQYSINETHLYLQQIILKNNKKISQQSYNKIGQYFVFSDNSLINKIDISGNMITPENFKDFVEIGQQFLVSGIKNERLKYFPLNQLSEMDDKLFQELVDILLLNDKNFGLRKISLKNTLTQQKIEIINKKIFELQQQNIELSLIQLRFDNNVIPSINSMVQLLESFLFKNKVCPNLEEISFSYCEIQDEHIKQIQINYDIQQYFPLNLKKLTIKGNNKITFEGWDILTQLLFTSGNFSQLECIDLSDCNLEKKSVDFICSNFSNQIKDKPQDYKQPLKSLILNNNPKLQSDDWQNLFESIIFCKYSQIKSLDASNSGFNTKTIQFFLENISKYKEKQKQEDLIIEGKNKYSIIKINIEKNDLIDVESWKQFTDIYLLNKSLSNSTDEEIKQQKENEKEDKIFVKEQLRKIGMIYSDQFEYIPEKNFNLQILDLKGTNSLSSDEWKTLFDQLIFTNRSNIETLDLSATIIKQDGWQQIFNQIQNNKEVINLQQLKIKKILFNDNNYLKINEWECIFSCLFFNTNLILLKDLSLDNCNIEEEILKKFNDAIQSELELEILSLRRNKITNLNPLSTDKISKLQALHIESEQYVIDPNSIPTNIKKVLKVLSITLNDNDILNYMKRLKQDIPNLQDLQLIGQCLDLQSGFEELILFVSENFQNFKTEKQHLKIDKILNLILLINLFEKKIGQILLNNFRIDSLELEFEEKEGDSGKVEEEKDIEEQNNKEREKKRKQEDQKKAKQLFEQIKLEWNIKLKQVDVNIMNLITINLSNTKGSVTNSRNSCDQYVVEQTFEYIFCCCRSLKNLFLSDCFMSNSHFQTFINLYEIFQIINNLVNNVGNFFTDIYLINFKIVKYQIQVEILCNFESKDYDERLYTKFSIKELYLQNININFIYELITYMVCNHSDVQKIYLNYSSCRNQQRLNNYIKSKQTKIELVYFYNYSFKSSQETQNKSSFDLINMWKQALNINIPTRLEFENKLTKTFLKNMPQMSLDIIKDFLEPMNLQFQKSSPHKPGQICDISTLKEPRYLCFDHQTLLFIHKYFSNSEQLESDQSKFGVHPTSLILNEQVLLYLKNQTIYQYIYFIQPRNMDIIDTKYIYMLYLYFRNTKLKGIIIDYDFKQSELYSTLSEETILDIIKFFPPKSLELTNVSMNTLKMIYLHVYSQSNFRYANINTTSLLLDVGVSYSLREKLYLQKKYNNFIRRSINYILYLFFDLFCSEESNEDGVIFDKSCFIMNENLKEESIYFNMMQILLLVYYFICILVPTLITRNLSSSGVALESHCIYAAIAVLSLIAEIIVHRFVYIQIKHLFPNVIDSDGFSNAQSIFGRFKNLFRNQPKLFFWLQYFVSLIFSQLNRFDMYSDFCFIAICFKTDQKVIGIISSCIMGILFFSYLVTMFRLNLIEVGAKRNSNISIPSFLLLSILNEFETVNDILEKISPESNRFQYLGSKFIYEDLIQAILQIIYTATQSQINFTVILSLVSTIFSLLCGFYKFMSMRPITITQFHFDKLSKTQKDEENDVNKNLKTIRNNMLETLQLTIDKMCILDQICVDESFNNQVENDKFYNKRNLEIDITSYKQTEQECLQDLKNVESLIKLGQLNLYFHYDMKKAKKYFFDALFLNKNDPDVYLSLAQLYIQIYRYEGKDSLSFKIEEFTNKASEISPNYWKVYYVRYQFNVYKQELNQAQEEIKKALEQNKNLQLLIGCHYFLQCRLFEDICQKKLIIKQFEDELNNSSFIYYNQYYQLGFMNSNCSEVQKAIDAYEKQLFYTPNDLVTLNNIGLNYQKQKQYDIAEKYYQKAIELYPNHQVSKDNYLELKKERENLNQ